MSEETKSQFQRTSSQLSSLSPPLENINLEQTQKCPCVQLFRTICLLGISQSVFFSFFDYLSLKSSTSLYFDISECCIWIIIFITGHFQPASINFTFFAISILKSLYSVHYYLPHLEEINTDIDNFSAIIVYCFIHFIQIILTSLTIKIKLLRLLALNISIIYFFIYVLFFSMGEKEHADILGVGAIIGLCAVNISLHFTDNSKKATNAEHLQLMKQIDGWRTLLYEVFPLGVVIAKQPYGDEKTLSVIYSNQACHEILKGSKNQQIDDELKRIFVDSPKCQMSDGYHSPNKNTSLNKMFLGGTESEKKNMCLFEDILRYFSQPSKEIEQDQEPKNEHLLASYMAVGWYLNEQQEKQTLNITAKKVIWDNEMYFVIAIKEISQIIVNERLQEIDQYKDQLLASVTHELKTPLNGILSIVEMAEQEKEILVIRGQLELIKKSGKMLEIILNDILDYSRLQKQKLRLIITKFDIEKTVDEVINLVQIQFSKPEIEIKKNIEIENTLIQSDSNRLKQIIFNLLTNAVKFTQKGSISVSISQSSQADCLSITVSDTGVGIPVSLQKKLFQLYGTFDHSKGSNRHGVGLGLVITKNLVQLLGPSDQITLKTSVGEGSSFTFDIFMELTLDENSQLEMENVDEQEDINNPNNINNNNTLQTNAFISCFNNINNSIHLGSPRIKAQLNELQNSTARNINNNIFNSRQATQVFDTDFALEQSPTVKNPYADILIENTSLSFGGAKSPFYVQPEKKHFRLRLGSLRLPQQIAQIPPFFPYPNKKNQRKSTLVSLERTPSPYHIDMSASCIISNTHQQIFPQNSQIFNPHATSNNYSYFHQLNNNNTVNLGTNTCINTNIPSSNQILLPKNLQNTIKNAPSSPEMRPPSFSYYPSTPPLKPYRGTSKMSTVASTYFQTGAQTVSELQCNLPNKQNSYESCSSPIIQFMPSKSNEIEEFSIAEPKQVKNGNAQVLESIFKTQKRILIVDDTYINITVLKMMLGKNPNLIIEEAFNGQQAIDKIVEFNQRNEPFNLVFMDVNMPVMDGLQAIEIIRQKIQDKEIPDLKIAVCSAFDDLQSRMKCLSVGADIHISKPINKSVMEQQLLQLFNDHQILN